MSDSAESGVLAPGDDVDLSNCDREPIHIPGAIQPHGMLLTCTEPALVIQQASENVVPLLAASVEELLGTPLSRLLDGESIRGVHDLISAFGDQVKLPPTTISFRGPKVVRYDATLHRSEGLLVIELEPAQEGGGFELGAFVRQISTAMTALHMGQGVLAVSERAVIEVKRLTGYDRVMAYRFDTDGHGEVIAEAREPSLGSFLGHHYPATDIPRQARALYLRQTVREIADIDYEPSVISPADNPLTGAPLNLGLAALRSVSPIHLQYLANMGVTGTMTISLVRNGSLWGMLACHHYSPRQVSAGVRSACELIGEMISLQLTREEDGDLLRERSRLEAIRIELLDAVARSATLAAGLAAAEEQLMELVGADGVSIVLDEGRITVGEVPSEAAEELIVEQVTRRDAPFASDRLPREVPATVAHTDMCGALAIALPRGVGQHMVFYRREWLHELVWGGDPGESIEPDLSSRDAKTLSPRRSFEGFRQAVYGRSRPWRTVELESALALGRELAAQVVASVRDELAHVALHDSITGLPNRVLLLESLRQSLRRPPRKGSEYVGLLCLDLDNFRFVNDFFGHAGGDELLAEASRRIVSALRHEDLVARLGGDEFAVLIQTVADTDQLKSTAQRIQSAFGAAFEINRTEAQASISIGIAWADLNDRREASGLLRDANTAMHEAKRRGTGQSVAFGAELDITRRRTAELQRHLRGALERAELVLEYQPVYTADLAVAGFEALVRWDSPLLGRVAPTEFLPVADELGLMPDVGAWVAATAFTRLAQLRQLGATHLSMAINLSARELAGGMLLHNIERLLDRLQIPPAQACLEVTEGVLVASGDPAVRALERIRELGAQVAIDDFGTGFSSLAYLRRLPADILKIDRGFVADLGHEQADTDVVGAVIDLAHGLGIRTVAEGVETADQLRILRELNCDQLQGFFLNRPLPSERLTTLPGRLDDSK